MNEDHEAKLAYLGEKLVEVFHDEADPANWPGSGKLPADQTKEERGDRAWAVKTANQVGLLAARALELRQRVRWVMQSERGITEPLPETDGALGAPHDPDADIKRFEALALEALHAAGMRRGK